MILESIEMDGLKPSRWRTMCPLVLLLTGLLTVLLTSTQSRHNPANPDSGLLTAIAEIFVKPNSDGSIFIDAEKVKTLSPLLAIEKITSVQTLSVLLRDL